MSHRRRPNVAAVAFRSLGTQGGDGPVRRLGDRGGAVAAPSQPPVVHLGLDRRRQRGALRPAGVPAVGPLVARPAHRLGPRMVRRLPPLHLLLRPAGPVRRAGQLRHPLRTGLQMDHRARVGPAPGGGLGHGAPLRHAACRSRCVGRPDPVLPLRLHVHHLRGEPLLHPGGGVLLLFSIVLALVFLGLVARGLRTGQYRGWAAVTLGACILAHFVPALFALLGAAFLVIMEMLPDRIRPRDSWHAHPADRVVPQVLNRREALWWGVSTVGIGGLLVAFWWVPFGAEQAYTTSMGYQNVHTFVAILFPQADWWALILAGISAAAAFALRSRFGILMTALAVSAALAVIFDPQGSLYNIRFLPLWFLPVYLLVGWGIATAVTEVIDFWERPRRGAAPLAVAVPPPPPPSSQADLLGDPELRRARSSWPTAAVVGPLVALVVALGVVVTPFVLSYSDMQAIGITPGPNQVSNWAAFNYSGYQGKAAYPEYRALVETMERVGATHGCGQAMWQYDPSLNRFGTTMALMLLPYWSDGCIGSMEGLLFESSATTPYHFLNQAELSVSPSDPWSGWTTRRSTFPRGSSTSS